MKPTISVILLRTKRKTNLQKFEAAQRWGPLNFLYLSLGADRQLGMPKAITVTLEASTAPVATDIPEHTQHTNAAPLAAEKVNNVPEPQKA